MKLDKLGLCVPRRVIHDLIDHDRAVRGIDRTGYGDGNGVRHIGKGFSPCIDPCQVQLVDFLI